MSSIDKRGVLKDNPFDYRITKAGKMMIAYHLKHVITLNEKDTAKLTNRIRDKEDFEIQLALAKATKNFKRGNERVIRTK